MLRAYGRALLALMPLLLIYWSIPYDEVSGLYLQLSNSILPFYFMAVTAYLGFYVARRISNAIWTPLVWFPVQSAVFYGLGPLVEIYGNEITRQSLANHYLALTPQELFRAHQLSVTGICTVLLGMYSHFLLRARAWRMHTHTPLPSVDPLKLAIIFLIVGGLFKYLIVQPAQWGMINILVPGVLTNLNQVVDLGFAITAFCAVGGNRKARWIMLTWFPLHVFLCALSFSKLEVVIAILLPVLAAFAKHRNVRKLLFNLCIIGIIFSQLQSTVHYGRALIYQQTGNISEAGYIKRMQYLTEYFVVEQFSNSEVYDTIDQRQNWWTRLNFAGPQVQAMTLYDAGQSNPQVQDIWMRFVPRAIWPEKPILYGPGLYFYRLVSSNEAAFSFLGLSIYGDLYWQYGWTGVWVGGPVIGWLFCILSAYSLRFVRQREFLMLPFVLMSLQMGLLSPNKFVINGIIGDIPILVFYYLFISGLSVVLRSTRAGRLPLLGVASVTSNPAPPTKNLRT